MPKAESAETVPIIGMTFEASASRKESYIDTSAPKNVYADKNDILTTWRLGECTLLNVGMPI